MVVPCSIDLSDIVSVCTSAVNILTFLLISKENSATRPHKWLTTICLRSVQLWKPLLKRSAILAHWDSRLMAAGLLIDCFLSIYNRQAAYTPTSPTGWSKRWCMSPRTTLPLPARRRQPLPWQPSAQKIPFWKKDEQSPTTWRASLII